MSARKPVVVKGVTIGGGNPLVCVPIVAADEQTLLEQARKSVSLGPDLIEWRVDFFHEAGKLARLKKALGILGQTVGSIPLLFTCRAFEEGGAKEINPRDRLDIIDAALASGVPSLIDFELSSGTAAVQQVIGRARAHNVPVILSFHDFLKTPSKSIIKEKLHAAQQEGGDVAKVAVMPQGVEDVLTLLEATVEARKGPVDVPLITMAMGKIGVITRMAGWLFGSDVTFAVGEKASAPGQIPVDKLRRGIEVLRESIL
ncbi:hypothetical protein SY88_17580 [Clostridiales bacterium PH28_bin88]|nr:hypothetical protein SY88_17580 [Clostridiales bacterium PH28_bin88]